MKTGKVTKKFQLTLPKELVDELGLEAGQPVQFELEAGGILITPLVPINKLRKHKKTKGDG